MFTFHVDLGQVIISILIAIVGWFVKRTIDRFDKRIDNHENVLFNMNGDLQLIVGQLGIERRQFKRRSTNHDSN